MRLGRVINGRVCEIGRVIMRRTGELVYIDTLSTNVLLADGWKEIIADPPSPPLGQCACVCGFTETDTTITLKYEMRDISAADRRAIADAIRTKDIAEMTEREKTEILKYLATLMEGGR